MIPMGDEWAVKLTSVSELTEAYRLLSNAQKDINEAKERIARCLKCEEKI